MVELVHDASWDLRKSTSWGSRCPSRSRPNQISSWPFSVLWSPTCQPARLPVRNIFVSSNSACRFCPPSVSPSRDSSIALLRRGNACSSPGTVPPDNASPALRAGAPGKTPLATTPAPLGLLLDPSFPTLQRCPDAAVRALRYLADAPGDLVPNRSPRPPTTPTSGSSRARPARWQRAPHCPIGSLQVNRVFQRFAQRPHAPSGCAHCPSLGAPARNG